MRKTLFWIFMLVMIILLIGCGDKPPATENEKSTTTKEVSNPNEINNDVNISPSTVKNDVSLPSNYPKELPLAVDAEIIDVRENPASKGLEVMYVSDNDIDTLRDFYEGALKDAKDLNTKETTDGYWITAKIDSVDCTIMLSKDAMNPNPQYSGKVSVYLILAGLE